MAILSDVEAFALKMGYFDLVFYYKELASEDYQTLGDWDKADSYVGELEESLRRFPDNTTLSYMTNLLKGRLLLRRGQLEESEACLKIASKGSFISPLFAQTALLELSRLECEKGDYDQATTYLLRAYNVSKSKGLTMFTSMRMELLSAFVELELVKKGSLQEALNRLEELKQVANTIDEDWARAYVFKAEGMLHSNQLDFVRAEEAFRASIKLWEKLSWRYELAKTKLEFANELYASSSDFDLALKNASEAYELFQNFGAQPDSISSMELSSEIQLAKTSGSNLTMPADKSRDIFSYLLDAFIQDSRTLSPASSGWRTLAELARNAGVSASTLYGRSAGQLGPTIKELLASRVAEAKTFPGERGRGGEVTRFRIKHEDAAVKAYVTKMATLKTNKLH